MNTNNYNIGKSGRKSINQHIYKPEFTKNNLSLTPEDILGTVNCLLNIKNNKD
jgi:hypothetical protein